jgi:hypothetical protein
LFTYIIGRLFAVGKHSNKGNKILLFVVVVMVVVGLTQNLNTMGINSYIIPATLVKLGSGKEHK